MISINKIRNIKRLTVEERLEELTGKLEEARKKEPLGFNYKIADLSAQVLKYKKMLRILEEEEKNHLLGLMIEYAYYMKTDQRDERAARNSFEKILSIDPSNPEAHYRYAYLHYEERRWSKAIQHFEKAAHVVESEFPLSEDQKIKAHLFISYCSAHLAKNSLIEAEKLLGQEEAPESEGISIEELALNIKGMLDNQEYRLLTDSDERLLSKQAYETMVESIDHNQLVLDLTTNEPYIKYQQSSCEVSFQLAVLLKKLLLAKGKGLSLADVTGFQDESIAEVHDITWENYRQKISRLNKKLTEVGLPEKLINKVPTIKAYQISNLHYFIFQFDAK